MTLDVISLGPGVEVAPGLNTALSLSISSPAPVGGLTVTLVSSDPGIGMVTSPIFIPDGQVVSTNPIVTGVSFGVFQVTATAPNYAPDTQDVVVTLNLTFVPSTLTVVENDTNTLTLNLSVPASPGGGPVAVVLDVVAGKVYWTLFNSNKIQRGNMDGSGAAEGATNASPPRARQTPGIEETESVSWTIGRSGKGHLGNIGSLAREQLVWVES